MENEKTSEANSKTKNELKAITREFMNSPLAGSEERFQALFEHSNDAVFLVDISNHRILDANMKACQMLEYSHQELLSLSAAIILPHESDKLDRLVNYVLRMGSGTTNELVCRTKSGRLLTVQLSASAIQFNGRMCLLSLVKNRTEEERLGRENEYLHEEFRHELGFGTIVGTSPHLQEILEKTRMVAPTDASVLITGESGTGKELVARAIHEQSHRHEKRMVRVNCASIPRELFESEFFGHVRGAFTGAIKDRMGRFEIADQGTLFLDEVGEIPLSIQGKLLRVLQDGVIQRVGSERTRKVDVRIISATNRDLGRDVEKGRFRRDLYYRLNVFPINLAPLRERPDDIEPLAIHFINQAAKRFRKPLPKLNTDQMNRLMEYRWPGNIRELQTLLERAMILYPGDAPTLDLSAVLPQGQNASSSSSSAYASWVEALTLADVKDLERKILDRELKKSRGRIYGQKGAARALGLKPTTLVSRLKKMGIRYKDSTD